MTEPWPIYWAQCRRAAIALSHLELIVRPRTSVEDIFSLLLGWTWNHLSCFCKVLMKRCSNVLLLSLPHRERRPKVVDPSMCRAVYLSQSLSPCSLFLEPEPSVKCIFQQRQPSMVHAPGFKRHTIAHAYSHTALFILCSTSSVTGCLIWHTSAFYEADLWCVRWLQAAVTHTDSSRTTTECCKVTVHEYRSNNLYDQTSVF